MTRLVTRRAVLGGATGVLAAVGIQGTTALGQHDWISPGYANPPTSLAPEAIQPESARTAWFREAKFGLFIHWGPYSVASVTPSWTIMEPTGAIERARMPPGGMSEAEYRGLAKLFNPVKFDPDAFVELARSAGQRYITFVTKHHDGFCMFDSLYTDYKITNTPYKRDITKQLADACERDGMPLAFYYSPPDMNHPAFRDTSKPASTNWLGEPTRPQWPIYLEYMGLQLTELLTRYGPVATIWFDAIGQKPEKYDGRRFLRLIHEISPNTLINDRLGIGGDFITPEKFVPTRIPVKGGPMPTRKDPVSTNIPEHEEFRLFETCAIITKDDWSYNKNAHEFKSSQQLIRLLVDIVSRGGNLLLDIGPKPDGTIQSEFQVRLRAMGIWLRVNGDAIYGTTYGPLQGLPFARTTAKGKNIYIHVFDWPKGALELPSIGKKILYAALLSSNKPLVFRQDARTISIDLPTETPDPDVSVIRLETA